MYIGNKFAQIIAKSISNDGKLSLDGCKITNSDFAAFSIALGDKHVISLLKSV